MSNNLTSTPTRTITLNNEDVISRRIQQRLDEVRPHELALWYFNETIRDAKGEYFRLEIKETKKPAGEHRKADYCQYRVIRIRDGVTVYSSKERKYRDPSSSEDDQLENKLIGAAVIKDSEKSVTYALRTGAEQIKVFCLEKDMQPKELACDSRADIERYRALKSQQKLLPNLLESKSAFEKFITKEQKSPWQTVSICSLQEEDVCLAMSRRRSKGFDNGTVSRYRFHIWNRMQGICTTEELRTDFKDLGRYHSVEISCHAVVELFCQQFMTLRVVVTSMQKPGWKKLHTFHVDWARPGVTSFERRLKKKLFNHVYERQLMREEVQNGRISNFVVDVTNRRAAFVLSEEMNDQQTRYSVWSVNEMLEITRHQFTRIQKFNPVQLLHLDGDKVRVQEAVSGQIAC